MRVTVRTLRRRVYVFFWQIKPARETKEEIISCAGAGKTGIDAVLRLLDLGVGQVDPSLHSSSPFV